MRHGREHGFRWVAALLVVLSVGVGAACDDGASSGGAGGATSTSTTGGDAGCANDPFACADGKTCGFVDVMGAKLDCLPSGASAVGATCKNIVGAPECGDDLICLQLEGQSGGVCEPFCDASHPCTDGVCTPIHTAAGNVFHACVVMTPGTTSSTSTGSSMTSSSSSGTGGSGSSSSTGP